MSLVEDARRDVASDLKEHLIQRYLAAMEDIDESALRHEMAVLGAGPTCQGDRHFHASIQTGR